jgi:hypothetical protein
VEDCLARWPQFATELEPLLRVSIIASDLSMPEASFDPLRRVQFMAELRGTQQRRPGFWPWPLRWAGTAVGAVVRAGAPAAAVGAAALVLVLARGGSEAHASTLSVFAGTVARQQDGVWVSLADGALVAEGDRVRTNGDGLALMTFADGTTVAIDPATEVTVERALTSGVRQIALRQWSGRLWHDVAPDGRSGSSFTVHTPDSTVVAHGTVFETTVTDETVVRTAEGLVEVIAGTKSLHVAPGETANAREQTVVRAVTSESQSTALTVAAPFVASLIGPDGRATGALPTGLTYQQIPGVFSSDPAAGDQHIALSDARPGEYTLVLRRVGTGGGEVTLSALGDSQTVSLPELGDSLTVMLRIAADGSRALVAPTVAAALEAAASPPQEKVVVTERARARAAQAAREWQGRKRETPVATVRPALTDPGPQASATPTRTASPLPEPTVSALSTRTPSSTATPLRTATATRTASPTRTPAATATPRSTATPRADVTPRATPSRTPAAWPRFNASGLPLDLMPAWLNIPAMPRLGATATPTVAPRPATKSPARRERSSAAHRERRGS